MGQDANGPFAPHMGLLPHLCKIFYEMNLINHCYYDIEPEECIVWDFELSRV